MRGFLRFANSVLLQQLRGQHLLREEAEITPQEAVLVIKTAKAGVQPNGTLPGNRPLQLQH